MRSNSAFALKTLPIIRMKLSGFRSRNAHPAPWQMFVRAQDAERALVTVRWVFNMTIQRKKKIVLSILKKRITYCYINNIQGVLVL